MIWIFAAIGIYAVLRWLARWARHARRRHHDQKGPSLD
jgi:hypothetical protein